MARDLSKLDAQTAFWESMKTKYEQRNEDLKQRELCLRKRLEELKKISEQYDCVPQKLKSDEYYRDNKKPSLVHTFMENAKNLIMGNCKVDDISPNSLRKKDAISPNSLRDKDSCAAFVTSDRNALMIKDSICSCNDSCEFFKETVAESEKIVEAKRSSGFSLGYTDVFYMGKLADLLKSEEQMKDQLEELEARERSYRALLADLQLLKSGQNQDPGFRKEFEEMMMEVKEENKRLKNDVNDMKLELKHCFERIEGPIRHSLENEQRKCFLLEKQLESLNNNIVSRQDSYSKEINTVKAQLCETCCTMVDLTEINSKLKQSLANVEHKCTSLEDELLKQKLHEAETILKFKNALSRQCPNAAYKGDDLEQDLGNIARNLSATLCEISVMCPRKVPSGLEATVNEIKQLADVVTKNSVKRSPPCSCLTVPLTDVKKFKQSSAQTSSKRKTTSVCSNDKIASNQSIKDCKQHKSLDQMISIQKRALSCECPSNSTGVNTEPDVGQRSTEGDKVDTGCLFSEPDVREVSKPAQYQVGVVSLDSLRSVDFANQAAGKTESFESIHSKFSDDWEGDSKKGTAYYYCQQRKEEAMKTKHVGKETAALGGFVCAANKNMGQPVATRNEPVRETQNFGCGLSEECVNASIWVQTRQIQLVDKIIDCECKADFKVETKTDILKRKPDGVHVVSTITKSGTLEIVTEGPPGVIETKLTYDDDGKIIVFTELKDLSGVVTPLKLGVNRDGISDKVRSEDCGCPIDTPGAIESEPSDDISCLCPGDNADVPKDVEEKNNEGNTDEKMNQESSIKNFSLENDEVENIITIVTHQNDVKNSKGVNSVGDSVIVEDNVDILKDVEEQNSEGNADGRMNQESSIKNFPLENDEVENIKSIVTAQNDVENSKDLKFVGDLDVIVEDNADISKDVEEQNNEGNTNGRMNQESPIKNFPLKNDEVENIKSIVTAQNDVENSKDVKFVGDSDVIFETTQDSKNAIFEKVTSVEIDVNNTNTAKNSREFKNSLTHTNSNIELDTVYHKLADVAVRLTKSVTDGLSKRTLAKNVRPSKAAFIPKPKERQTVTPTIEVPDKGDFEDRKKQTCDETFGSIHGVDDLCDAGRISQLESISKQSGFSNANEIIGLGKVEPLDISSPTFQCYMYQCNEDEQNRQDDRKHENSRFNGDDLEHRIDRLLEIDPLQSVVSHGTYCQCIDCLVVSTNSQRGSNPFSTCKNLPRKTCAGSSRQSGGAEAHDENCTCVDCLCKPCTKVMVAKPGAKKCGCGATKPAQPIMASTCACTKRGADAPCDCGEYCRCDPCADMSVVKKPCASCKPFCPKIPKVVEPIPGETWQNVQVPRRGPKHRKPDCDCCVCECDPCGYLVDNCECKPGKKKFKPRCDCGEKCPCDSCAYQSTMTKEVKVTDDGLPKPCDCLRCRCGPCQDPKMGTPCDCEQPCKCKPCRNPMINTALGDNKTCECQASCLTSNKKMVPCNCEVCECAPCKDPDMRKVKPCDCTECKCDPCRDSAKNDKLKGCDGKICNCAPDCKDPKKRNSQQAVNDCHCDSNQSRGQQGQGQQQQQQPPQQKTQRPQEFQQQQNQQQQKTPHGNKECDCAACKCEPCSDPKKLNKPTTPGSGEGNLGKTVCDCENCACDPCADPKVEQRKVKQRPQQSTGSCNCGKSNAQPRQGGQQQQRQVAQQLQPDATQGKKPGGKICDCQQQCECAPCGDPIKQQQKELGEQKKQQKSCHCSSKNKKNVTEGEGKQCDCTPKCVCEPCSDKARRGETHLHGESKNEPEFRWGNDFDEDDFAEGEPDTQKKPPTVCKCKSESVAPGEGKKENICNCTVCKCESCPDPKIRPSEGSAGADKSCVCTARESPGREQEKTAKKRCGCATSPVREKEIEQIEQMLDNIRCSCDTAEKRSKTMQKCKDKDRIINCMTFDLQERGQSRIFKNLLYNMAKDTKDPPDYTRRFVCDTLLKPNSPLPRNTSLNRRTPSAQFETDLEPILELDRYIPDEKRKLICRRTGVILTGMEITDIRRVTIDSVLIKWKSPYDISKITGYQIFVNDVLKYKVLSPMRTNAVIDSLNMTCSLEFMLFAVIDETLCEPPAQATFKI